MLSAPTVEPVIHLTAPRPVSWSFIIEPIASRLHVPFVPAPEWLAKYKAAAEGGATESAFQLAGFFEGVMCEGAREIPFATERAVHASKSLAEMEPVGEGDVEKWMVYWARVGFLPA